MRRLHRGWRSSLLASSLATLVVAVLAPTAAAAAPAPAARSEPGLDVKPNPVAANVSAEIAAVPLVRV